MTDLNAPLGRRPRKQRVQQVRGRGRGAIVVAGLLVLALGVVNLGLVLADRGAGHDIALLTLPDPEPAVPDHDLTTGAVAAVEQSDGHDVDIVYGDGGTSAPVSVNPAGPEPEETRLSPGGPKIITIRDPSMINIGQRVEVAHLPEDSALEDSEFGPLPVRAQDGRRPADIYARPWSGRGGKRIAVVIGGLGLSQTGTQRAIDRLPPEITLAFAPTGNSLNRWMRAARKKGHELLVQVPMEPFGYPQVDPGKNTLRLASSPEANLERLHWALGRLTNYSGVMNYMGARFAADERAMAPVLGDLAYRGLLFFNDGTAGGQALAQSASHKGVPYLSGDVLIDNSQSRADIVEKLRSLEALASSRGFAVGTGAALELTVDTVSDWANDAKKRGFEIVGVAALASRGQ